MKVYLKDIIDIAFELPPVIDIRMLNDMNQIRQIIREYKVSDKTANEVLVPTLRYLTTSSTSYPLLLQGPYGAGKSHTLCLLASILLLNEEVEFWKKDIPITNYPELSNHLGILREKKYLPITIDCLNEKDKLLKSIISEALIKNCNNSFAFASLSEQAADHLESLTPEIQKLFDDKLQSEQFTLRELVRNLRLKSNQPKLLEIYNNTWKKVINVDIKSDYNLEEILRDTLSYSKTEDIVVVLLLDELYNYILAQYSSNQIHDALGTLQQLAQFCAQNSARIKLIGVNHTSDLSNMGIPEVMNDTLRKVMQRFEPVLISSVPSSQTVRKLFPLKLSMNKLEEMLKNNSLDANFLDSILFFSKYNDSREVKPTNFYPFHPELIRILPWIVDRFGQSNRTSLQFLKWAYETFQDQDILNSNKTKIISFPELYDFFVKSDFVNLSEKPYTYALGYSINQAQNIPFGTEIVKCLAIRYLASDWKAEGNKGSKIFEEGLTSSQIANLLQVDERTLVASLKQINDRYIFFDKDTTKYIFLPSVGQDSNSLIEELEETSKSQNYIESFESYLKRNWIHEFSNRTIYNPVERHIPVNYILTGTKCQSVNDIEIVYVFPQPNHAPMDFEMQSKSTQGVVFVELEQFNFVFSDFCKYTAIEAMLLDPKFGTPYAQAFLNGRKDLIKRTIELNKSRTFNESNYIYWWSGIRYKDNLVRVIEHIESMRYPDFPNLNIDTLRQDKKIATQLFPWIFKLSATCSGDQELLRNMRSILPGLGLADILEETDKTLKYQIRSPQKGEKTFKIWNVFCTTIEEDPLYGLSNVYKLLEKSPFGLTPPLIDLYLAAYLAMNKGSLIKKGSPNSRITITPETSAKILKGVDNYRSRQYVIYKTHGISYEALLKLAKMYTEVPQPNERSEDFITQKLKELRKLLSDAITFVDSKNRKKVEDTLKEVLEFFSDTSFNDEKTYNTAMSLGIKYIKIRGFYEAVNNNRDLILGLSNDLSIFNMNNQILDSYNEEKNCFIEALTEYNKAFSENDEVILERALLLYKKTSEEVYKQYRHEHVKLVEFRKKYYEKLGKLNEFYDCSQNERYQKKEGGFAVCKNVDCKYSVGDKQAFLRITDKIEKLDEEIAIKNALKNQIKPQNYEVTIKKQRKYNNALIRQKINSLGSQFERKTFYSSEEIVQIVGDWVIEVLKEGAQI